MTARSAFRRAALGALRRAPLALVPAPARTRALNLRAKAAPRSDLDRLASVQTDTLIALLAEPPGAWSRGAAPQLAQELARRSVRGAARSAAVEAVLGAGQFAAAAEVLERNGNSWRGLDRATIGEIAETLREEEPSVPALVERAGGGSDGRAVVATVAAGVHAWDVVAQLVGHEAHVSQATLRRWALVAVRDGELASACAIDDAAGRAPMPRRDRERLDRAHDRLALLDTDLTQLALPRVQERYEARPDAVLYVASQSLPQRSGGYATRTHGVVRALADAGWDMRVLTRLGFPYDRWPRTDTRTVPDHDVVDGIPYWRALRDGERVYPQTHIIPYVKECAEHVIHHAQEHRAQVIHAASFYHTGLAAALAAEALDVPFIYEIRGFEDLFLVSRKPAYAQTEDYRFLRAMETEVCRRADAVLCITRAIAEDIAARGIPRERIHVLSNGVEPQNFEPRSPDVELAEELGVAGSVVIGYAGGMVDYEGLEMLSDAVAELDARGHDVALVFVGDGMHGADLRRHVEASPARSRVRFVGRVPHSDVARYLSIFDVMPFPRLPMPVTEEVSPMKPFEAMAMGKAVLVSDVAALTEIVTDGVDGLTFRKGEMLSLADQLERLVVDSELRARLGEAARQTIQREAPWARRVRSAEAVYRSAGGAPEARD